MKKLWRQRPSSAPAKAPDERRRSRLKLKLALARERMEKLELKGARLANMNVWGASRDSYFFSDQPPVFGILRPEAKAAAFDIFTVNFAVLTSSLLCPSVLVIKLDDTIRPIDGFLSLIGVLAAFSAVATLGEAVLRTRRFMRAMESILREDADSSMHRQLSLAMKLGAGGAGPAGAVEKAD